MKEPKMIVCAKQVPDPEGPPSAFQVDPEAKEVTIRGIPPVIDPYGETALEAALQIKEDLGGEITVLSVGENLSEAVLSKALAAGADELVLVQGEGLKDIDSYSTAQVLSKAIEEISGYDIVLTGRQAGDWDAGQVGLILSEFLGIPGINWAQNIEIVEDGLVVEKLVPGGYEVVEAPLPALVTASSEIGELRYVSVKALKKAREKPIRTWSVEDLGIDISAVKKRKVIELFSPSRERECTFIEGETLQEAGENLAVRLKEDKII